MTALLKCIIRKDGQILYESPVQTLRWDNIPWITDVLEEYYYKGAEGYSPNQDLNVPHYESPKNRRYGEYHHHRWYKEGGNPKTMQQLLSGRAKEHNLDKLFVHSFFTPAQRHHQLFRPQQVKYLAEESRRSCICSRSLHTLHKDRKTYRLARASTKFDFTMTFRASFVTLGFLNEASSDRQKATPCSNEDIARSMAAATVERQRLWTAQKMVS